MTSASPVSATVIVKSVPRIPIVAEFVLILMFSLGIRLLLELIKRPVPLTNDRAIVDLLGFGSNTKESITTFEFSVNLIVVSSRKVTPILPAAVSSLSIELSEKSISLV